MPLAQQCCADRANSGSRRAKPKSSFGSRRAKTNPETATILGVGLTTVKKHLEATFAKLGVENRTSAAAMALENLR